MVSLIVLLVPLDFKCCALGLAENHAPHLKHTEWTK